MTVAALSCAASAQQVTPTAQDPAAAIREWVRSDHSDEALREAATKAVLDAGDAGLRALAETVRRTRPDQRDRRIGVESLVATVVVGILERAHDSGMRFAGQYDRLRALQPYAGTFLVQLVVDTPDWFPDDMRALVVPARDCLWGAAAAAENGWTRERNWWYFVRPRSPGEDLRRELDAR